MTSSSDDTRTIKKLKSLFYLLDPENSSYSEEESGNNQEIWERFKFIEACSRRVSDYYHRTNKIGSKCTFRDTVPRFMHLLRESVLSHQWPEALKLVHAMCDEFVGTDSIVWKIGLASLFQDKERNGRLVEQFVKHVYVLRKVAAVEVMLDYLLYLLGQSNTKDAGLLIQELKLCLLVKRNPLYERRKLARALFFAYQGLACYVEWKLAIYRANHQEDETEIISQLLSQGLSGREAQAIAEEALEHLLIVKDTPGVWDIFITRITEIYEYYGKIEEASNILSSYRERNPTNPNAHRYLYEFECKHGRDETLLTQCLEDIIKLDPCNCLCVNLYRLKERTDPAAVSLLFEFLDYPHCSGHEEVWQVLADRLSSIDSRDLKRAVKKCWRIRKDWWPNVIFKNSNNPCYSTQQLDSKTLLRNKITVQNVLFHLEKSGKKKKRTKDICKTESDPEPVDKSNKKKKRTKDI